MLDTALKGNRQYWALIGVLAGITGVGFLVYLLQFKYGLGITGMSRDVSWGFYIAQFTFLVGVAAGGVMLVLPYYLHNYKVFGKITILGEFLAISAVSMCLMFIIADLGQPMRAFNVLLYPTPNSMLFWDMIVLNGYLFLNVVVGWSVLEADRNGVAPPKWVKPLIYLSVPWAFGIHTVTAYLYCGLPGRHFWLTAILAPRFLASAFAAGPALIILLAMVMRKFTRFDAGKEAIQGIARIVTYALIANVFFFACEVFVAFYSNIPGHMDHIKYLFVGLHGHGVLVPWMWTSLGLMLLAIVLLVIPKTRANETFLAFSCIILFIGIWIDKGLGMISGGFVPSPMHHVTEYIPTVPEIIITIGIYGAGALILVVLYKIALTVKAETGDAAHH
ncbi:sulfate reduction electron transfer complex DsrMKJOP subunit DsrP [Desulfosudis oleivorans]|uniref:Polysulphide reductase NrfD n=1 Tax=Desulfosudis oleivorans (strain DSM 6200 / JCM 39069 / Hxd3) TaxID=96561 RepID=A8ZTK0_DESOH|nr:NrfD/PsrC family molybdoenzyme membrane anchor subunit [Desulfosudis oleivorans]ABW66264.1 Polysulphide reductase NrfD [Desulfosudis oleivorans Hxd3]